MTDKPENPPAFPLLDQGGDGNLCMRDPGMSLRDWFAGLTMQGMHAHCDDTLAGGKYIAIYAYQMADAMLAERQRK